jgi:hypothetical protein
MPDYLSSLLQSQMDDKVESELTSLLNLYIRAQEYEIDRYNDVLRLCAASLTSTPPRIKFVKRIRKEISRHLTHRIIVKWLLGGTPLGKVMMGLFALLYFLIPISLSLKISDSSTVFSVPIEQLRVESVRQGSDQFAERAGLKAQVSNDQGCPAIGENLCRFWRPGRIGRNGASRPRQVLAPRMS